MIEDRRGAQARAHDAPHDAIAGDDPALIGPLRIPRLTGAAARARIYAACETGPSLRVAFCNAHTAQTAFDDAAVAVTLARTLLLNDGIGIELAARALEGRGFPANLNGTDFVPTLLADAPRPLRLFLVGARPTVVTAAAAAVRSRFPQHAVVGARDGFFTEAQWPDIVDAIVAARPDIVLCAMGDPRQHFVTQSLQEAHAGRVLIGVGALFDFLAGAVPRAPRAIRRLRLEFLYRLAREPRRLGHRYTIEIGRFLFAVARLRRARRR